MYIDNKYNLVLPKTIDLPKEVYLTFVDNNTLIICSKINELSFSKDKDIRNTIRIILSNTFKVINNNGLIRIPNVILDKLNFEEFNIEYTSNNSIIVKGKSLESSRGNNV